MVTITHYIILGGILFCIGMYGVLTRRNLITILMSLEIMLNAVNLTFIGFAHYVAKTEILGHIFVIFIITVAAGEATVALAIVLGVFRNRLTINIDEINLLKW